MRPVAATFIGSFYSPIFHLNYMKLIEFFFKSRNAHYLTDETLFTKKLKNEDFERVSG